MAYIPRRFIVVFMLCMVMVILHSMRTNVAVAVLEFVHTLDQRENSKNINNEGEEGVTSVGGTAEPEQKQQDRRPYNLWTSYEVSYVHAAFYVGYVSFQLPAAWTTTKLPSNRMLCLAVFTTCTLNLIIPACFNGKHFRLVSLCV